MAKRVLIVDDNDNICEILAFKLRCLHYDIVEAEDGYEAVTKSLEEKPDLIIMDLGVPGISGIDATIRIKQNPETAVIAHTAWPTDQYRNNAIAAGMVEYLTKPRPFVELTAVLDNFLRDNSTSGEAARVTDTPARSEFRAIPAHSAQAR